VAVTTAISIDQESWNPWLTVGFGYFGAVLSSLMGTVGHGKFTTVTAYTYRQWLALYELRWLSGAVGALAIFCAVNYSCEVMLFNDKVVPLRLLENLRGGYGLAFLATSAGFSERLVRGTLQSYTECFAGFMSIATHKENNPDKAKDNNKNTCARLGVGK
jgi:hypothetical protein